MNKLENLVCAQGQALRSLCIVTDAWKPQVNGVVTYLDAIVRSLAALGVRCDVIHPGLFRTLPFPGYAGLRMVVNPWAIARQAAFVQSESVHIATEGPLGLAARSICVASKRRFSSAIHTKFPEYLNLRTRLPVAWFYPMLRRFHERAAVTMVQSRAQREELQAKGFTRLCLVGGGVDTARFSPSPRPPTTKEPKLLFVGRVAPEKNLPAFLDLAIAGSKVVVGDGPSLSTFAQRYPHVEFRGVLQGAALVDAYRQADVFVFPSRTDTLGLVSLEAMACGTPVAAFPVTGPRDLVVEGVNGALDENLAAAINRALQVDRHSCRSFAEAHDWRHVAKRFMQAHQYAEQSSANYS